MSPPERPATTPREWARYFDIAERVRQIAVNIVDVTTQEGKELLRAADAMDELREIADEAAAVRRVARRGMGYGWKRFDALVRKAGVSV